MVDQRLETVGEFCGVDAPIAKAGAVMGAGGKPAVIDDEALRANGAGGKALQHGDFKIEIDRLPRAESQSRHNFFRCKMATMAICLVVKTADKTAQP